MNKLIIFDLDGVLIESQAIDHFDRCYVEKGTVFNPEHLMTQVCSDFDLQWPNTDFTVRLRPNGDVDFGRW